MLSKQQLFSNARQEVSLRRQQRVTLAEQNHSAALAAIPELKRLEDTIRSLGFEAAYAAASGVSRDSYQTILNRLTGAREARDSLLASHGISPQSLEFQPFCPKCKDTGTANGKVCTCITSLCRQYRREEILNTTSLSLCDFSTMLLKYYPNVKDEELGTTVRDYMSETLSLLKQYAEEFDLSSSNLLIIGNSGLGKTHAALAIAGIVLDKGYDVIYISSQQLFDHLERNRFDEEDPYLQAVLEADLLILDDLGTEYASSYVLSSFYNILNTRLGSKLPTIYTSNITDGQMFEKRYTEKIASRLGGSCEMIIFRGDDIRLIRSTEE